MNLKTNVVCGFVVKLQTTHENMLHMHTPSYVVTE